MNTPEKNFTPEDIEGLLSNTPTPTPPIQLLEDLKSEIPSDLEVSKESPRVKGARPQTWLLAATLATVAFGAFLAQRVGNENGWTPDASPQRDSKTSEPNAVSQQLRLQSPEVAEQEAELEPSPSPMDALAHPRVFAVTAETSTDSNPLTDDEVEHQLSQLHSEVEERERQMLRDNAENLSRRDVPKPKGKPRTRPIASPPPVEDKALTTLGYGGRASEEKAMGRPIRYSTPSTGGTAEPNDQPYGDMFFDSYGTNPFIDTEDDHLSTFAMDVDTGSYTVARSYLDRGHLPPQDAIRVEEFLNYFNYNDRVPRRGDFALSAEGAPSPFASGERQYLLRFGIQGREIQAEDRDPATLIFVVDVSGSMDRENRLGLVKKSLRLLLGELTESDRVGLVVYGSRGEVLLEPTSNHSRIERAIERLRATGSTNAEEGLVLAYDLAQEYYREGAINRVILCSDGVANVGHTGPDSIFSRIEREADGGIELTTVGFGMGNYNDVLMEQLADKGDGRYSYVDDISEARRLFVEELTGTLQTIASEAKIQVEFDPQVVSRYRLIGYENRDVADRDFRNDKVDAGEIGAGHHVTALYEIKLHEDIPRNAELATLRVRYHSKERDQVIEQKQPVRFSEFDARLRSSAPSLRLAALVAEFGEILKGSFWAKDGDLNRVAAGARELARETRDPKVAEFHDLVKTTVSLQDSGQADPDWIKE